MNLLEGDESDWEFYLGVLRAAVANHKLADGMIDGAMCTCARRSSSSPRIRTAIEESSCASFAMRLRWNWRPRLLAQSAQIPPRIELARLTRVASQS